MKVVHAAWIVAATVGPGLFHSHLARANVGDLGSDRAHRRSGFNEIGRPTGSVEQTRRRLLADLRHEL